jgi:hypothetical protein
MRKVCFTILGLVLMSHQLLGQCRADIAGKVVDASGTPIRGALVSFLGSTKSVGAYARRLYETNENGEFKASLQLNAEGSDAPGLYWVLAKKEDSGYPDNITTFYTEHEPPQVELDCGSNITGFVVKLGTKCAYITRINVVDAVTGAPIENASITFSRHPMIARLSQIACTLGTSAQLPEVSSTYPGLPIPSNTEVSYQVSASGYVTSALQTIQLAPLQSAEITVKLQRSTNPGEQP